MPTQNKNAVNITHHRQWNAQRSERPDHDDRRKRRRTECQDGYWMPKQISQHQHNQNGQPQHRFQICREACSGLHSTRCATDERLETCTFVTPRHRFEFFMNLS